MSALTYIIILLGLIGGSLLILIGVVWLIFLAIRMGKTTGEKALWAIANLFCQPISGIIFFFVKKAGLVPLLLIIVGLILQGIGGTLSMLMMTEIQRTMTR